MNNLLFHFVILSISLTLGLFYKDISLLFLALIFLFLLSRYSFKYVFVALVLSFLYCAYFNYSLIPQKPTNNVYTVIKVNKFSYHLKNDETTILLKSDVKLNKGALVSVNGQLKEVNVLENFRLFSMINYLKSQKIFYEISTKDIKIIKEGTKKEIKSKVNAYFNYLFFMEKDDIDDELKTSLIDLAIIHLVVVSGFHFNYFYKILNVVLDWLRPKILKETIILGLLFFYLFLLAFSYPAFRAFLSLLLKISPLNNHLSSINQLALTAIIILIIFPLAILSYSFILTFVITLVICLIPRRLTKNKVINSFVIFLGTIPLITSMNYQISLSSFILLLVATPFIMIMYFVVLLGNYLNCFEGFALDFINFFEKAIDFLTNYNLILETGAYTIAFGIIYYLLYFIVLWQSKHSKLLVLIPLMFVIVNAYLPSFSGFVTFLNVGQADCIIIKPPFSNEAMIIDAPKPYQSNTINNVVIPYLKAHKIKKVHTLVITHDDLDHAGGKDDLVNNFNVGRVISNKTKEIRFDDYHFIDVLASGKFKDKNTNSITLYTRINGLNYLFSGDIDSEAELEMNKYVTKLPVDILKVAHHGSKTSTSNIFLALTNPKIAIIQAKKDNHYNHPHPEVINRLRAYNSTIYNNATNGTITIYFNYFFNYLKVYK